MTVALVRYDLKAWKNEFGRPRAGAAERKGNDVEGKDREWCPADGAKAVAGNVRAL
jgi:hypothetical protein